MVSEHGGPWSIEIHVGESATFENKSSSVK